MTNREKITYALFFFGWVGVVVLSLWLGKKIGRQETAPRPAFVRIGDACDYKPAGDEEYFFNKTNGLTCAEWHEVKGVYAEEGLRFVVYLPGSKKTAVFSGWYDAMEWAGNQQLVVNPKQVR